MDDMPDVPGFPVRKVAAVIPVSREVWEDWQPMRDLYAAHHDAMLNGYTVHGPTEPVSHYVLPEWDEDASPEWRALYAIASEEPSDCYDCHGDEWAIETARDAIGGGTRWTPGPPPGRVPGLREAFGRATEEPS